MCLDIYKTTDLHGSLFNDMGSFPIDADLQCLFDETDQFMLSSPPYCEPLNDWEYQPDDRDSPATVTSASSPESVAHEESLFFADTDPKLWHLQQGSPCSEVSVQSPGPTTPLPEELEHQDVLQYLMKVSNLNGPVEQNGSPDAISLESETCPAPTATSSDNSALHGLESDVATSNLQAQKSFGSVTTSTKTNVKLTAPPNANSMSTRGRKRKSPAPDTAEDDEITDPVVARNAKNAIAARENRLKKKKYVEGLESEISSLKAENETIVKENDEHKQSIKDLTEQLEYYKSVLYNQSSLSNLLKSMNPEPKLRLGTSVGGSSRHVVEGQTDAKFTQMSGGVCLHVNGPNASLEFCAKCSVMSQAAFNS